MLDEQLSDLLIGKVAAGEIEPKSLGSQPAAVDKLNVGVKVGTVLGHASSAVECALGLVEPEENQGLDRIRGPPDLDLDGLPRAGREVSEQEVGGILPARRTANPDAYAVEVAGAEGFADGPEAIMAVVATTEFHPELAGVDVKLIMYHNHLGWLQLVVGEQPADRPAGLVHERARFGEHEPRRILSRRSDPAIRDLGPRSAFDAEAHAQPACQVIGHAVTNVVPVGCKGRTRVAEPDDQP
jgi:hypothetical protein